MDLAISFGADSGPASPEEEENGFYEPPKSLKCPDYTADKSRWAEDDFELLSDPEVDTAVWTVTEKKLAYEVMVSGQTAAGEEVEEQLSGTISFVKAQGAFAVVEKLVRMREDALKSWNGGKGRVDFISGSLVWHIRKVLTDLVLELQDGGEEPALEAQLKCKDAPRALAEVAIRIGHGYGVDIAEVHQMNDEINRRWKPYADLAQKSSKGTLKAKIKQAEEALLKNRTVVPRRAKDAALAADDYPDNLDDLKWMQTVATDVAAGCEIEWPETYTGKAYGEPLLSLAAVAKLIAHLACALRLLVRQNGRSLATM